MPEPAGPAPLTVVSNPTADDRLLLAGEVAEILQVTTAWVYAETRQHRLPHIRLGRFVRYRRSAVDRFIAELEAGASAPARTH